MDPELAALIKDASPEEAAELARLIGASPPAPAPAPAAEAPLEPEPVAEPAPEPEASDVVGAPEAEPEPAAPVATPAPAAEKPPSPVVDAAPPPAPAAEEPAEEEPPALLEEAPSPRVMAPPPPRNIKEGAQAVEAFLHATLTPIRDEPAPPPAPEPPPPPPPPAPPRRARRPLMAALFEGLRRVARPPIEAARRWTLELAEHRAESQRKAREAAAARRAARASAAGDRKAAQEAQRAAAARQALEARQRAEAERLARTRRAAPARKPDAAPPPAPAPTTFPGSFAPYAALLGVPIPTPPPEAAGVEATDAALATAALERFRATPPEQASFPTIALQILDQASSPDADVASLAGVISRDPVLSAGVISVANSPVFRGLSEVESVRDAVARLGMSEVGRVAAAVAARTLFTPQVSAARVTFQAHAAALFTRSVAVGSAAAAVGMRQRGARTDHVYLGGLLHDIGKALGLRALAAMVLEGGQPEPDAARLERVLDAVHVEIGAAAREAWALPQYLAAIIGRHHEEALPAEPGLVDLHLVRLTSALAALREGAHPWRSARELTESAQALRLDPHAVRALASELKEAERRAQALPR